MRLQKKNNGKKSWTMNCKSSNWLIMVHLMQIKMMTGKRMRTTYSATTKKMKRIWNKFYNELHLPMLKWFYFYSIYWINIFRLFFLKENVHFVCRCFVVETKNIYPHYFQLFEHYVKKIIWNPYFTSFKPKKTPW